MRSARLRLQRGVCRESAATRTLTTTDTDSSTPELPRITTVIFRLLIARCKQSMIWTFVGADGNNFFGNTKRRGEGNPVEAPVAAAPFVGTPTRQLAPKPLALRAAQRSAEWYAEMQELSARRVPTSLPPDAAGQLLDQLRAIRELVHPISGTLRFDDPEWQLYRDVDKTVEANARGLAYLASLEGIIPNFPFYVEQSPCRLQISHRGELQPPSNEKPPYLTYPHDANRPLPFPFGAFLQVFLKDDAECGRLGLVVHELCLVNASREYQRIVFVERNDRLVFGFIANELLESPQRAYLAYLEKSTSGIGQTAARVLEAYFKYMAFAHPNIELHIWADPPDPGKNYLFRLPPDPASRPSRTGEQLRDWYTELLVRAVANCKPRAYSYKIHVPSLPPFGKKSEALVKALRATTEKLITVVEEQFSAYFQNTVFVRLPRNRRHTAVYDFGLWEKTETGFLDSKRDIRNKLDYTNMSRVSTVTREFVDDWKASYPFGYRRYGDAIPETLVSTCKSIRRQMDPAVADDSLEVPSIQER